MTEALQKKVQSMLNEEKFTRQVLSAYSIDRFKELDITLDEVKAENALAELKEMCDDHLGHTKNSIIAVYFSGMTTLAEQRIDDVTITNLVTIFVDNHKWNIVKYLCDKVLEYGESKFALRTLADCYKNDNHEDELYAVWERLVRVDAEEADIAKLLGEKSEKDGDMEKAVDYYKKALARYINKQLFANVRELWLKLLEYQSNDIDYFLHTQTKVARAISSDKASTLLGDIYTMSRSKGDIDMSITILKMMLDYNDKDITARKNITECFKEKYAQHSRLDDWIKASNIEEGYRNVHEAISDFEKHIAFDKGSYVFHSQWGIGKIAKADGDNIVINFSKKRGHEMSIKMAINALKTLTKDHIWVLKATGQKEELREKIKSDIPWALKTLIKSFDNACDFKRMKAELVPLILTLSEWTAWSTKAKNVLKTDPSFGVRMDNIDVYLVREHPVSADAKLFIQFKAEKKFFKRVEILRHFVQEKTFDAGSQSFDEMFAYFTTFLKNPSEINVQTIGAYLFIRELMSRISNLNYTFTQNFVELFDELPENIFPVYDEMKDFRLKDEFIKSIKLFVPGWENYYIKLFPQILLPSLLEALEQEGFGARITQLIQNCYYNYKDYSDAVVWFYANYRSHDLYKQANILEEKELITLIYILENTFHAIEDHRNTAESKRLNKQVYSILFEEDKLLELWLAKSDRNTISRIWTLLYDIHDLDPEDKQNFRHKIMDKYPDFKFKTGAVEKPAQSRGLIVTLAKLDEKQKQLDKLQNEDVPANSKEISFALSLGDLRENAEYKAAKEKQEILNTTITKLKNEIERAQPFDVRNVTTERVSFGTKVFLRNGATGGEEVYSIFGPWESDPNNKIISYLSPFGAALMNKKAGESFDFLIDNRTVPFTVNRIETAVDSAI
ncbi:MAG: transcription elongation factor GreA [Spirochaetaceae bacterium]|jgi:transcription elongation factor GreA|nr:transcription elongation factor GreA [Spirochaetaceae bacterium]